MTTVPPPPPEIEPARLPVIVPSAPSMTADLSTANSSSAPQPNAVAAEAVRPSWVERRPLWILAALTLFGGLLRFWRLGSPSIWGDEAQTYGRVVGTYQQLLDQLITDGFGPLHYSFYWWLNSSYHLSPSAVRWLLDLLVVCLTIGLILVFAPRGNGKARWPFVLASAIGLMTGAMAMVGAHAWVARCYAPWLDAGTPLTPFMMRLLPAVAGTAMVPAMYFLARQFFSIKIGLVTALFTCTSAYMLTYSRDAKMYQHFWLCCALFVACLLWWLRSRQRVAYFAWLASGVGMVGLHKLGLIVFWLSVVFFLLAPRQYWLNLFKVPLVIARAIMLPTLAVWNLHDRATPRTAARRNRAFRFVDDVYAHFHWPPVIFYALGMALIFATLYGPWGYYNQFNVFEEIAVSADGQFNPGQGGVGWVDDYNRGRSGPAMALMTSTAFLYSWEWARSLPENPWLDDAAKVAPRTLTLLKGSGVFLIAVLLLGTLPWRKLFAGRRVRATALPDLENVYAPYRRMRILWLAVWILVPIYGVYVTSFKNAATPWDMATYALTKQPVDVVWPKATASLTPAINAALPDWKTRRGTIPYAWQSTKALGNVALTVGRTYAKPFDTWATAWRWNNLNFTVIIPLIVIAASLVALSIWRWRIMVRPSTQVLLAFVGVFVIGCVIHFAVKPGERSVWMPRYVGVTWPAFAIVTAALLMRLPTRPVRWLAIFGLVAINLAQFGGRVLAYAEPPTGRIAADLWAAQERNTPTRTFFADMQLMGINGVGPGGGLLGTPSMRYYLSLLSAYKPEPSQIRQGGYEQAIRLNVRRAEGRNPAEAGAVVLNDLARNPGAERIILWSKLPAERIEQPDNLGVILGDSWKRVSDETMTIHDHWRWMDLYKLRRREYVRKPE